MDESDNDRIHVGANAYLDSEQQRKLWDHVRYLENQEQAAQDIRDDVAERKKLAKSDGFDPNILAAVIKRRKLGKGQTRQADSLVRMYEQALEDAGVKPIEDARPRREADERRSLEEIDQALHGDSMIDP